MPLWEFDNGTAIEIKEGCDVSTYAKCMYKVIDSFSFDIKFVGIFNVDVFCQTFPNTTSDVIAKNTTFKYFGINENSTIPFKYSQKFTQIKKPEKKNDKKLNEIKVSDIYKYNNLSKYVGLLGKIPIRAETTYVGVEIELEKVQITSIPESTWKITDDGSLKDHGIEFVTVPIQFRYLEVELERLFKGIKTCEASSRCSVHVHINSRDFTLEELKTFIALYMVFERSLYHFSGNRWNNNFCVPLGFYHEFVRNFIDEIDHYKIIPEKWFKYFGFNLSPLFGGESTKIGTIEFRHMKGTTDVQWIVNWINLIVSLKISAKKFSFEEISKHLETMNTTSGYYWLAEVVFKDNHELITKQSTFKQDIENCIAIAKSVFLKSIPTNEIVVQKVENPKDVDENIPF